MSMSMSLAPDWIHLLLDVPRESWQQSIAFWSAATGWSVSAPRGETRRFVTFDPGVGDAWLKLQAVEGGPRVHLDLDVSDPAAAAGMSIELGARPAWRHHEVAVMRSPGGLLFCLTHQKEGQRWFARADADAVLDQVCLDIPAPRWDAEVAFWQALTGRELEPGSRTEFAFLGDPDRHGALRILLQRLDSHAGDVAGHADFAVADRAAHTARHVDLGAQVLSVMDWWTVMRAPDQHVYCLTDREPATGQVRR